MHLSLTDAANAVVWSLSTSAGPKESPVNTLIPVLESGGTLSACELVSGRSAALTLAATPAPTKSVSLAWAPTLPAVEAKPKTEPKKAAAGAVAPATAEELLGGRASARPPCRATDP